MKPEVEYNGKSEALTVEADITGDGQPDITLKVRVGALLKHYAPHIAAVVIAALAGAHYAGLI